MTGLKHVTQDSTGAKTEAAASLGVAFGVSQCLASCLRHRAVHLSPSICQQSDLSLLGVMPVVMVYVVCVELSDLVLSCNRNGKSNAQPCFTHFMIFFLTVL
jgi:hypothetical protein